VKPKSPCARASPSLKSAGCWAAPNKSNYRWRTENGGLKVDQATRLKGLERENSRLNRVVTEVIVDKLILKEAVERNC